MKLIRSFKLTIFLGLLTMSACSEPGFVGEGVVDLTKINLPYQMKELTVDGTEYLAVVNTNYKPVFDPRLETGSLHFYDISNPASISRNTSLDLELPTNVSDLELVTLDNGTQRLVVLDRNENEIRLYDLSGGSFQPVLEIDGVELKIETFSNPQALATFQGEPDGTRYIAVLCQSGATIQFFNIEESRNFNETDLNGLVEILNEDDTDPLALNRIEFISRVDRVGASLEMKSRNTTKIRGISGAESRGRGIGKIFAIDGGASNGPVLVTASYTDEALFGFRFNAFDNTANLLWDPDQAINGEGDIEGTKEQGFRGIDFDNLGNLIVSSRADNRLYRVPFSQLNIDREDTDQNTLAFERDETEYQLDLSFDSDPTDKVFPRLGDLVVKPDGSRVFVIGMEDDDRGLERSRVYLVNLDDPANPTLADTTAETDFEVGDRPQKLYYDADSDSLIVAVTDANRLQVYDVSGDSFNLLSQVENPAN